MFITTDLAAPEDCDNASAPPLSSRRASLDVATIATIAGLCDSLGNAPLDACVPIPTRQQPRRAITRDEIRVLLNADGILSLKEIADDTGLSLDRTIAVCLGLMRAGLIELAE